MRQLGRKLGMDGTMKTIGILIVLAFVAALVVFLVCATFGYVTA